MKTSTRIIDYELKGDYLNEPKLNFYGLDAGEQISKLYKLTCSPFLLRYSLTSLMLKVR